MRFCRWNLVVLCFAAVLPSKTARADPPPPLPPALVSPTSSRDRPLMVRIGALAGVGARLDAPPDLDATSRVGGVVGLEAVAAISPSYAVGASLERASSTRERGDYGALGAIDVSRATTTAIADLRVSLFELGDARVHLALGAGFVFHSLTASGTYQPYFGATPAAFSCSGASSANLALRLRVGVTIGLGPGLQGFLDTGLDSLRGDDTILDDCAPGPGTSVVYGLRGGLGYAFDVTRLVR